MCEYLILAAKKAGEFLLRDIFEKNTYIFLFGRAGRRTGGLLLLAAEPKLVCNFSAMALSSASLACSVLAVLLELGLLSFVVVWTPIYTQESLHKKKQTQKLLKNQFLLRIPMVLIKYE